MQICMKCQYLFCKKNKKKSSAEFAHSMLSEILQSIKAADFKIQFKHLFTINTK